jgi:hypothetical protein
VALDPERKHYSRCFSFYYARSWSGSSSSFLFSSLIPIGVIAGLSPGGYFYPIHANRSSGKDDEDERFIYTSIPAQTPGTVFKHAADASECYINEKLATRLTQTPGFPLRIPVPESPFIRVSRTASRGFGVFATRSMRPGEIIHAERPIIVSPSIISTPTPSSLSLPEQYNAVSRERRIIMQSLLMRSSRQKQEAYHKLFNCNIHNGSGTLYGIQRTNGFSLGLDEGKAESYGNFFTFC